MDRLFPAGLVPIKNAPARDRHTGGEFFQALEQNPNLIDCMNRTPQGGAQCPTPKTLLNALACLKNVPNGQPTQFPESITEKWPLIIERCRSNIRK